MDWFREKKKEEQKYRRYSDGEETAGIYREMCLPQSVDGVIVLPEILS